MPGTRRHFVRGETHDDEEQPGFNPGNKKTPVDTTKQLKNGLPDTLSLNVDAELVYLLYSQASAGIAGSLFLATCVVFVL